MPKPELANVVMPFGDHLEELRRRVILALVGVLPILIVALVFGKAVLGFLLRPVVEALIGGDQAPSLQVTSPFESFSAYVKVAIVLTILIGAPWIVYQLWKFVAPGLYRHERRFAYILAPLSTVLTVASGLFLYYAMLPAVLYFFVNFNASLPSLEVATAETPAGVVLPAFPVLAADPVDPPVGAVWYNVAIHQLRMCVALKDGAPVIKGAWMAGAALISQQYRVGESIAVVLNLALALAIAFQTPVVVLLLGWAGIVTPAMLTKYRRYALMLCAVLGAVLTPADPISMALLAVPLYVLYELGGLLLRLLPAAAAIPRGEHARGDEDPFARPDDQ